MENFKEYSYYYDAFYGDKDYRGEAECIKKLFNQYGKDISKVISFGCGTGKHDFELNKLGYHMTGIDLSSEMVEIAKKNAAIAGTDEKFIVADIREFEPSDCYDAVVSLFHVMSYQNSNDDVISSFRTARKCLSKGGIFIFDAWYGPGVLTDLPSVRVKKASRDGCFITRIATPSMYDKKNVVDVNYEIIITDKESYKIINETHRMRYFFVPEIELMLKMADFELIDNVDCQSLQATDYGSWTCYFIVRAV